MISSLPHAFTAQKTSNPNQTHSPTKKKLPEIHPPGKLDRSGGEAPFKISSDLPIPLLYKRHSSLTFQYSIQFDILLRITYCFTSQEINLIFNLIFRQCIQYIHRSPTFSRTNIHKWYSAFPRKTKGLIYHFCAKLHHYN